MSSKITLQTPITDKTCLEQALQNKGIVFTRQGNDIILSNKIVFSPTEIGFTASLAEGRKAEPKLKEQIKVIYKEYDLVYKEKIKRLEEKEKAFKMLHEKDRQQVLEERATIQKQNQDVVDGMVKKIEAKAKQKGFKIQKIVNADNSVQLVLVRQTY